MYLLQSQVYSLLVQPLPSPSSGLNERKLLGLHLFHLAAACVVWQVRPYLSKT